MKYRFLYFPNPLTATCASIGILKDEFPKIPVHYIEKMQAEKTHLFPTYMALVDAQSLEQAPYTAAVWRKVRRISYSTIAGDYGDDTGTLKDELAAARKARVKNETESRKEAAHERDEQANFQHSKASGATAEWYVYCV